MADVLRRHKYALNRILIPAARILSPEFNAIYVLLTGSHVELLRNLIDYANRETTFVDEYHDDYYTSPDSTDWDLLQLIVSELEELLMSTGMGFYDAYVCVRDKKTQGTHGGTFTAGAWRTRDINDEQADAELICTIASNQITLLAGTYRCLVSAPAYDCYNHQIRVQNITDTATLLMGTSEYARSGNYVCNRSFAAGEFTLDDTKVIEIQHQCYQTQTSNGFGNACDWTDEIYTIAEFWRKL